DSWPAPHAAAAVVSPAGVQAVAGDVERPFRLASLTKPLAALATLVAVEEEAIGLDDLLAEAPMVNAELAAALPGATLRHLLAHASGLAPDARARAAAPGTRRIYSNTGFDLIGEWVAAATDLPFTQYLSEAVFIPLQMRTARLDGSPAKDALASVTDLTAVLAQLLTPGALLHPSTLAAASTVQFPGLAGVLPGYGPQPHNDWGLGLEIRADKRPHWTAPENSPATYGHFGRSGTMFWVDPLAQVGLVALTDRDFDDWVRELWPQLSSAVLAEYGR
ncbi:MAG: serine hydrolase, partial [Frankiales bacterium]|nr:serine hydrolase [Frankiales bacterium]